MDRFFILNGHSSEIDAYGAAFEVLPKLAALDLGVQSRQEALTRSSGRLARRVSLCLISEI
ncbi:hypothetical protein GALMADRAFT_232004 [Galerina marginata CBS 339.88]|uniref:Uncharacterized protein n=1 Tax=Galerina marginata (strain CBS 339.88) TaxID=685588 RepID=A0A067S9J3_GALM3|nr:hypothetical protein GALMADRAFT_232004 [Galerina marginata CBS 339.88]